jgi:hypothetical protein
VEARNAAGAVLILPLQDISGGYTLQSVTGMDPVKANIVTSSSATRDGTEYESASRGNRDLVLKIGFAPDWALTTAKLLRDNLYNWFMTKQYVELRFYEDSGLVVSIVGRVESNDSPRFTADPDATISVVCFLPDFIGMTNEVVSGNSVADSTESTINYAGTSETGFLFTLNVNRTVSGFSLYQRGLDSVQYELDFVADLVAGDVVTISTQSGNKFATLTHAGVNSSILYGISPSSPWLVLTPGANKMRLQISGAPVPYSIAYTDKYGGL